MRIFFLSFIALLLYSCSEKKGDIEFNIKSVKLDIDTTGIKEKYKDFETQIQAELLKTIDTSNLWNTFENQDTLLIEDLDKKLKNIGIENFTSLFHELSKPYEVKDYEKDVFHFEIMNSNFIEIEISQNELVFNVNKAKIQSRRLDIHTWDRLKANCDCSTGDNLIDLFKMSNTQGEQIYRLDIVLNKEYNYCWKSLKKDEILMDLLKMIENKQPPTNAKNEYAN